MADRELSWRTGSALIALVMWLFVAGTSVYMAWTRNPTFLPLVIGGGIGGAFCTWAAWMFRGVDS